MPVPGGLEEGWALGRILDGEGDWKRVFQAEQMTGTDK